METQNLGGQPPKYETPEEFYNKGLEYFKNLSSDSKPTITGLCLYLGFESRQSFHDYKNRDGFSYAVKRLRMMIEHEYEKKLDNRDYATAGVVFALKQLDWSDKQEIDHTTNGKDVNSSPTQIVFTKFKKEEE